jgi:thymidylate kinase
MPFRAIILEGVAGSGKSSLLKALLAHPTFVNRPGVSSLVLTEHHTQRVLEGLGPRASLRVEDNLGLLHAHVDYLTGVASRLDGMTRWKDAGLENPRFAAIIERFHLTHALNYAHLEWTDVAALDVRLAQVGTKLCLVTASPDELCKRLASRGPDWGSFLHEPGQRRRLTGAPSALERDRYFVEQQAALRELAKRSTLERIELDTTDLDPSSAAERLLELWLRA